jgi:PDZ domain-containing protein
MVMAKVPGLTCRHRGAMVPLYGAGSGKSKAIAGFLVVLLALVPAASPRPALAENVIELPVLVSVGANDRGAFEVLVMQWDRKPSPDPIALKWANARIRVVGAYLEAINRALQFAVDLTPAIPHAGTIWIKGASYAPTSTDGPSAGAAMAVGFLALLNGDPIQRGVALTGTIESNGRIGPVGAIPDKVRAAAREGYRTILIPQGQGDDPRWNLRGLALSLNVSLKEVGTVQEAYELMTGRRL